MEHQLEKIMELSNTQYKNIMFEYDQTRTKNQRLLDERYKELYEKLPELKKIQDKIIALSTAQARYELLHDVDTENSGTDYKKQKTELIERKKKLLLENGYDINYLNPIYDCPDCKDTGYINNSPCHCLKQYEIRSLYANSNLMNVLNTENFDTFNINYYDDTTVNNNLSLTARENIIKVRKVCLDFVNNFDNNYSNLIFYGPTGVGKTFLTHCIAKRLLDSSHTVVYLTSLQLFDILEKNKFNKSDASISNGQISYVLNCELLIIDDLGTELVNSFTASQLYYLIEERHLKQKSTIISTNLLFQDMRERYSERIFSRFTGYYNFYMIIGDDIRIKKVIS